MLENDFIVPFGILWTFFLQCTTQIDYLLFVTNSSDGLTLLRLVDLNKYTT